MRRDQREHAIRTARQIIGRREVIVVSILAASAPARGERGTGSHIRRTFVSLRDGGGYALRHIWTLEVVAPRPIRCGAAGS